MIPRLDRLSRERPHFKLHLAASDAVPDPALSGLDAALLAVTPPWPDAWQVHPLVAERIGPVLSPRHPEFARLWDAEPPGLQSHALLRTASRPRSEEHTSALQSIMSISYAVFFLKKTK